jgi:hypothetical protein
MAVFDTTAGYVTIRLTVSQGRPALDGKSKMVTGARHFPHGILAGAAHKVSLVATLFQVCHPCVSGHHDPKDN